MPPRTIDLEIAVKAAVARPGDTLLLVTSRQVSNEESEAYRSYVEEHIPGVEVVLVGGVDQALVYKPTGTAVADVDKTWFNMLEPACLQCGKAQGMCIAFPRGDGWVHDICSSDYDREHGE